MCEFAAGNRCHVFIIGSKGIPARYGGFETFVEKLTENRKSDHLQYHVACAVDEYSEKREFIHNGAHCVQIKWRTIGSARAIVYDIEALSWAVEYASRNNIEKPVFYVLACRIGPFIKRYAKKIHDLNGLLFVNPDGHEWMRAKWSAPVRRYWKISEAGMIKQADRIICDSKSIEEYIKRDYSAYSPKTGYIAYGADLATSTLSDNDPEFLGWLKDKELLINGYYLAVGRFVPENNYETMIREFMTSQTRKSFVLVTEADGKFLSELEAKTGFKSDPRIKFVGTVYDQELLKKIRENAFAYFHGHEVGGTNPSLLEALASTRLNLLLDVGFNREVAEDSALYWTKEKGSLASVIGTAEELSDKEVERYSSLSSKEIADRYSWSQIVREYETLFLTANGSVE